MSCAAGQPRGHRSRHGHHARRNADPPRVLAVDWGRSCRRRGRRSCRERFLAGTREGAAWRAARSTRGSPGARGLPATLCAGRKTRVGKDGDRLERHRSGRRCRTRLRGALNGAAHRPDTAAARRGDGIPTGCAKAFVHQAGPGFGADAALGNGPGVNQSPDRQLVEPTDPFGVEARRLQPRGALTERASRVSQKPALAPSTGSSRNAASSVSATFPWTSRLTCLAL